VRLYRVSGSGRESVGRGSASTRVDQLQNRTADCVPGAREPGSRDGPLGTALTRAGPQAAGLSRRCTGRPEVFYVPRGPPRRSWVGDVFPGARGRAAHGGSHFPAVGAQGPRRLRPCGGPTLADEVFRLVVRALVRRRAGRGACDRGRPALTGEAAGERARGGLGFCRHGRGRHRARGEGGFRCHWGYYWGGIVCPLVRRAVPLTSRMLVLPTHASGVDFPVCRGVLMPQRPRESLPPPKERSVLRQWLMPRGADAAVHYLPPAVSLGLPWNNKESQAATPFLRTQRPTSDLAPEHSRQGQPPQLSSTLARHGRWFATRPRPPPGRLGMALRARRPNYYPARHAPPPHPARPGRGGGGSPGETRRPWGPGPGVSVAVSEHGRGVTSPMITG